MTIEIDKNSGFCFGVVNAIQKAEEELLVNNKLLCLGDIVHNNVEVMRLEEKGLVTINREQFKNLKNQKVLIRAHGEPPETYIIAKNNNIQLIDATCPVVLKLQKKIKKGFQNVRKINGQIVIFGKKGHAEVNGLVGQTNNKAIVISNMEDLTDLDYKRPIIIYSQTTRSHTKYKEIIAEIEKRAEQVSGTKKIDIISNDTICRQVYNRDVEIRKFCSNKDIIIFISGKKSSNGKVLFQICKQTNKKTYFISDTNELKKEWFKNIGNVGICGATSTPFWLMKKVKNAIIEMNCSE